MKTTILTFFVTIIIIPLCAFGQQGIFEYAEERSADLTTEQLELLEKLKSQPQTVHVHLVTVTGATEIGNREQLFLNLPNETVLTVERTSRLTLQGEQVRWTGSASKDESDVRLLISQGSITGMLRSKTYSYDLHPLRDSGFHVLVEIDPSGFDREEQPLMIDGVDEANMLDKNGFDSGLNTIMSNPEIRLMVVYTTNAKNNHVGDINQMISFAVGNMEDAFTSSGVNTDINLVYTAEISYSEDPNSILNICRLTTSLTFTPGFDCSQFSSGQLQGHMNQIHEWRYQHDAHLVVLITGSGGAGVAWTPASNNLAFSIARYDVAASNYTLAHEIGHNLGAGHDPDNNNSPVYPYAHGYIYSPLQWTTILAYPPSGYSRINRYSTPLKTFAGVTTGTASLHDNARAMNNRVNSVANFTPPAPPPPPPATPSLSGSVTNGMPYLSWSSVAGATSYKINRTSFNNPSVSDATFTTSGTSYTDSSLPFMVQVDIGMFGNIGYTVQAVNSSGESTPSQSVFYAEQGGGGWFSQQEEGINTQGEIAGDLPSAYRVSTNYPNPFNPTTTISYDLPESAYVSVTVFDIMGRQVRTLLSSNMSAGFHSITFDASNLSSGLYIAHFTVLGVTGNVYTKDVKMQLVK